MDPEPGLERHIWVEKPLHVHATNHMLESLTRLDQNSRRLGVFTESRTLHQCLKCTFSLDYSSIREGPRHTFIDSLVTVINLCLCVYVQGRCQFFKLQEIADHDDILI